jgi:hypothetical protein
MTSARTGGCDSGRSRQGPVLRALEHLAHDAGEAVLGLGRRGQQDVDQLAHLRD